MSIGTSTSSCLRLNSAMTSGSSACISTRSMPSRSSSTPYSARISFASWYLWSLLVPIQILVLLNVAPPPRDLLHPLEGLLGLRVGLPVPHLEHLQELLLVPVVGAREHPVHEVQVYAPLLHLVAHLA